MLILDLDPQGNASTGLGIAADSRPDDHLRRADGRLSASLECALPTAVPGLFIVPANADLVGIEIELTEANRPFRLRDAVTALAAQAAQLPADKPSTTS